MKRFALLAAVALSAGCYKLNYVNGPVSGQPSHTEDWHNIMIFGLVEISDPIPLTQLCPNGWTKIHNEESFENGLVNAALWIIALGWIYSPHAVTVWCAGGGAYDVELNADGLVTTIAPHDVRASPATD